MFKNGVALFMATIEFVVAALIILVGLVLPCMVTVVALAIYWRLMVVAWHVGEAIIQPVIQYIL